MIKGFFCIIKADPLSEHLGYSGLKVLASALQDTFIKGSQVFFTYLLFKPYEVVEPKEEPVVETQEHVVEEKEVPVVEEDEPVADEEPVSESEEQVQDEVVESEEEVVPTDVSEEDAEVLATLPEDDEAETEEVDVIGDVFGTSEEELKTRDRAEALSAEIELPDSL